MSCLPGEQSTSMKCSLCLPANAASITVSAGLLSAQASRLLESSECIAEVDCWLVPLAGCEFSQPQLVCAACCCANAVSLSAAIRVCLLATTPAFALLAVRLRRLLSLVEEASLLSKLPAMHLPQALLRKTQSTGRSNPVCLSVLQGSMGQPTRHS